MNKAESENGNFGGSDASAGADTISDKADTTSAPTIPATGNETGSKPEVVPNRIQSNIRIVKIEPRVSTTIGTSPQVAITKSEAILRDFICDPKDVQKAVSGIISVVDDFQAGLFQRHAETVCSQEQAERVTQKYVRISEADRETLERSGSRIIARRIKDPDILDLIAVGTVLASGVTRYTLAVKEIREIARQQQRQNQSLKVV